MDPTLVPVTAAHKAKARAYGSHKACLFAVALKSALSCRARIAIGGNESISVGGSEFAIGTVVYEMSEGLSRALLYAYSNYKARYEDEPATLPFTVVIDHHKRFAYITT